MNTSDGMICPHVRELHGYVPGEQPRIPGLIKLNTNENPYPPSPHVLSALSSIVERPLRIYPDPVSLALRTCIAELHDCAVENVFVGNGSDEVLALCTRAFVENRGTIGCFEPSYSLYPILASIRPAGVEAVALNDDYTWNMPEKLTSSLFYLTNPNAPTSMLFPKKEIEAFCDWYDGVVLIDEAYGDFAPWNCMDMVRTRRNVLVSRSLSKSYSLAGIRAGYVVGPADLIAAMFKIKDSYNVNAITQQLALAAIKDQAHMKANVARIIATRERVAAELRKRGFIVYPSAANFLWTRPPGKPASDWFQFLRENNILIRYFPGKTTGQNLRITIGTDQEMEAFLSVLSKFA